MTRDEIALLFKYDRWANRTILRAVSALTDEQFSQDLGGGLKSVRNTLVHIIASEWGWLQYWKQSSPGAEALPDLWTRCDTLFNPNAFPDVAAVHLKWTEVEKEQAEFVNRVTGDCLKKLFPCGSIETSLAHLVQHMANHSTYHRGQVALMMRRLGAEPAATDFHVFLAEALTEPGV